MFVLKVPEEYWNMEVEDHATVKLKDIALSPVEQFLESSNIDGDVMFASFEI